jgi:hypothetical protein
MFQYFCQCTFKSLTTPPVMLLISADASLALTRCASALVRCITVKVVKVRSDSFEDEFCDFQVVVCI